MKSKIKVTFLGWQERINKPSILLVNEFNSHSTVAYDEEKHILINHEKLNL